ncbi:MULTISPECIES: PolC-type DNA polymerase III [unclassified Halanaerobium]|uniref:PolC-type DNA polymerase III n=1 Tax=unclassified Halanaerobium TaxID=2641197 RepID=UPI000DF3D12D|nr:MULTISPECIES: PolC-type DNA polymerase III [unclassified Halanaerobium]RCW51570.1 DNA polymerase-3 subunit alpha (Gram-positive type) [Halanaerobium sp. MA284_MarDTE_T2]RCW89358.1 DNA polymerase-3 subunit alpha (Gram-positive type) [Halanaerobium sp. DL-01]
MNKAVCCNIDNNNTPFKYILCDEKNSKIMLLSTKKVSSEEIKSLIEKKLDFLTRKYQIEVIDNLSLKEEITLIWPHIIRNFKDEFCFTTNWLKRAHIFVEDNQLMLKMETEVAKKALAQKKVIVFLEKNINKYLPQIKKVTVHNGDFLDDIKEKTLIVEEMNKNNTDDSSSVSAEINNKKSYKKKNKQNRNKTNIICGRKIKQKTTHTLDQLNREISSAVVEASVFSVEKKETRKGKLLYILQITDYKSSISAKVFSDDEIEKIESLNKGDWIKLRGKVTFDPYSRDWNILFNDMMKINKKTRQDNNPKKRVELHLHTQMSAMDSVLNINDAVKRAADWGHNAVAVTDHGVVQSFPDAYKAGKKYGVKIIYGLEAYLVDDGEPIITKPFPEKIDEVEFIVFDLETTGLNPSQHEIIEIGAVKFKNGEIIDKFNTFVNAKNKIPSKITEITGIKEEMLKAAPSLKEAVNKFLEFADNSVLVAHNADFDYGFIRSALQNLNIKKDEFTVLDTLSLSRALVKDIKNYKLNTLSDYFAVDLKNHHRALDDALATAEILANLLKLLKEDKNDSLMDINNYISKIDWKDLRPFHTVLLAKNKKGLKNLYKLVSISHLNNFYKKPRILKSKLLQYREGLLVGSACESGQLFKALVNNRPINEIEKISTLYDFFEIQPLGNNEFLIPDKVNSSQDLKNINKKIYNLGKKLDKPVAATSDVHFLDPHDSIFRKILQVGQKFPDADQQPPLYYRTTEEMLDEFSYLGKEAAEEVVITNTQKISAQIDNLQPIPDGLFTPEIKGAEEEIRKMSYRKARKLYGENLPQLVVSRLEKELKSIIDNGFAVIYLISHKLVKKSLEDGYLVGSRGSVGSSFVATMCEITEVNPLPPHYRCPKCFKNEFIEDGSIGTGVDLPPKTCPECGSQYEKDGFDIPFEVFMGFKGDKVPDIDLNFSGEYQSEIHHYTEEFFGRDYVFRAGTISTIAERTAFGFVKNYLDDRGIEVNQTEINRLVDGCTGVRKTTGQHPGGLMIVPKSKDIFDFSPIQHPANDQSIDVRTTHFDYHSISGRILKLDLLGHDDPTSIRMLQDLTGIDPKSIPLDDKKTMSIFSNQKALNLNSDILKTEVGTLGIPEFGTGFVRQMLEDTRPTTFAELVRISGLSHGTDVWLNNAQNLIKSGKAKLSEVISVRDDIMNYLLQKGVDPQDSFWIMEHVRKGKGLTKEEESIMKNNNIPSWYIDSCKKIKYMFPKAHAAAYVTMAFRIAYFKVHYPAAFYTTYFSTKADDFDAQLACNGRQKVEKTIRDLKDKGNDMTAKESGTLTVLKIVLEAMLRGIEFMSVDIYKSDASKFKKIDNKLLPPLISLQGLGRSAAESIVEERLKSDFTSIEDLSNRTSVTKTVIEKLREHGSLDGLPEKNQLSLF